MAAQSRCDICFYLPNLQAGGAEKVMVNLANGFAEMGKRVDLVLATSGGVNRRFVSSAVNVVELRAKSCFFSIPALAAHLRRCKPFGVVSTLGHANVAAIIANCLAGSRCRVIVRAASTVFLKEKSVPFKAKVLHAAIKTLYRRADYVVANSQGVANELKQVFGLPPQMVKIISNPVVTDDFDLLADEKINDPWLNDGSVPVVLAAGRLCEVKDYPTLIRAFAIVARTRPARLLILGDGEDRLSLERLIGEEGLQEIARLGGYVPNPFPYMKKCSCFVLSSLNEGCPNALIQALLLGAKVVSTDCQWGPREVLEDGKLGKLVQVKNIKQMADAILDTLSYKLGDGREDVLMKLRIQYSSASVLEQFQTLLESKK